MECPFCAGEPVCDYAVECEVLTTALDEAEELRVALNAEVGSLRIRIRHLEKYIMDAGMNCPPEIL